MGIDILKPHSPEKAKIALESELPKMHLENKVLWLYLVDQLGGTINRDEVEGITAKLSAHQNTTEDPITIHELCHLDPCIQRIPDNFFLRYLCFRYKKPIEELDLSPYKSGDSVNRGMTSQADILSRGNNLIRDLYWLDAFGETVTSRRRIADSITGKPKTYETYSLTPQGKTHTWVIGNSFKNAFYEHLMGNNFLIVAEEKFLQAEVVSRPNSPK